MHEITNKCQSQSLRIAVCFGPVTNNENINIDGSK
jgi:hypothetical protein